MKPVTLFALALLCARCATVPLAPLMSELTHSLVDVLQDEPERLHTIDRGEFRQDLD